MDDTRTSSHVSGSGCNLFCVKRLHLLCASTCCLLPATVTPTLTSLVECRHLLASPPMHAPAALHMPHRTPARVLAPKWLGM
eukprot:351674-Chlamydomonas_euryale.AAC.2